MAITKLLADSITSGAIANTPVFEAYLSADQTGISEGTATKVQFNTEIFDTNNMYDNSTNYRFTPTEAGKYFCYTFVKCQDDADSITWLKSMFYKNGSSYAEFQDDQNGATLHSRGGNAIIDFNGSSDYLEVYGQISSSGNNRRFDAGTKATLFGAYKIIE